MRDVFVAGIGMTPFGNHLDKSHDDLTLASVGAALADAACDKSLIDLVIYGTVMQGAIANDYVVPGQFAMRKMGIGGIPVVNVENACASSGTALNIAYNYIRAGLSEIALVIGTEKLNTADRDARFKVFNQPADIEQAENFIERYGSRLATLGGVDAQGRAPSILMESYAGGARMHMQKFGTTQEQLAFISSKNHNHSQYNPYAHYQKPMSVEEVLKDKAIAWPLTRSMCAPISDGSTAAILCSADALVRLGNVMPVRILSSVLMSGSDRDIDDHENNVTARAAKAAYEQAGIGPKDLSVVEVHDASAYGEVNETEALGLCEVGKGGEYAQSGATSLGGRQPVNTSGGLESRGHPLAATGLAQIFELTTQLRGQAGKRQVANARLALAQNGGGFIGVEEACACITILGSV